MLGPVRSMSNYATPAAPVGNVLYKRLQRVHGFARQSQCWQQSSEVRPLGELKPLRVPD